MEWPDILSLGYDAHGATFLCHLDQCPTHLPLLLNTKEALAKMHYFSWKTHLVSHLHTFSIFVDNWIAVLKVPHMHKWHLPQEFDNEFERKVGSAYKFFATAFIKPGAFCVQTGPHAVGEYKHIEIIIPALQQKLNIITVQRQSCAGIKTLQTIFRDSSPLKPTTGSGRICVPKAAIWVITGVKYGIGNTTVIIANNIYWVVIMDLVIYMHCLI